MSARFLSVAIIFPLVLCSCAAYEMATTKDQEEREDIAASVGMNPVVGITGSHALEEPSEKERQKNLLDYARTIRNRNSGKVTQESAGITILAMQYAYPLIGDMTEKEVVELLGKPDERSIKNGLVKYVYRIKGLREHDEPSLYLNLN